MDFGILVPAQTDDVGFISHMENLGYSRAWVGDSQMLWSDCYAVLALAAERTRTIQLGTGVAIPATRIAPVTAHSIASISRIAPGRTFLGLGTGYTAMRAMGQKPMKLKDFREYIRVVRALLRGEEVEYTFDGRTELISFLMADDGFVELKYPIDFHISAFGPKSQKLAGELGDGMILGVPRGGHPPDAFARAKAGAEEAGRDFGDFLLSGLANVMVLEKGESVLSQRSIDQVGAAVMVAAHFIYDKIGETGEDPPPIVAPIWKEYVAHMETIPKERRHLHQHASHYNYLRKDEMRFLTEDLVRANAIIGTADEVIERLRELESQGMKHLFFMPTLAAQYRVAEDFSQLVMRKL